MKLAGAKKSISRGFTVIESMIALVLMTFAILSMFGLISATFGYTEQDSEHIQAVAAGQQYLDTLRQAVQNGQALPSAPTINVDPGFGITGSQIAATQAFSMTSNGCPLVAGAILLNDCSVTVSWTEAGAPKSVSIESYVSQQ